MRYCFHVLHGSDTKLVGWGRCIAVLAITLVTAGIAISGLFLFAFKSIDLNHYRGWLSEYATQSTGLDISLDGDIDMHWLPPEKSRSGIERWLPRLLVEVQDLNIANPQHAGTGNQIGVAKVSATLELMPMLKHQLRFDLLQISGLTAELQRNMQGQDYRRMGAGHRASVGGWTIDVKRIGLHDGRIHLSDSPLELELNLRADSLETGPYGVGFNVSGRYHGIGLDGHGRIGQKLSLDGMSSLLPIEAILKSGPRRLSMSGTMNFEQIPPDVDLQLAMSAPTMADLYPLTGVTLPETPPFSVSGKLQTARHQGHVSYTFSNFAGHVGNSDLTGSLTYTRTQPRPSLSGFLRSHLLRLADLGPLVGVKHDRTSQSIKHRVLPDEPFRVARLDGMDAEVEFSADRIIRTAGVPIAGMRTVVHLNSGQLKLDPLAFRIASGKFSGNVNLKGRNDALITDLNAVLDGLQLRELFPSVNRLQGSLGSLNARIRLAGNGNSIATLLANADGRLMVYMPSGTFSAELLEEAGLNIGSVIISRIFGDHQIGMNCLTADFEAENGLISTQHFLFDSDIAKVTMSGNLDMKDESLALTLYPQQKSLRIFSLRAPLKVQGDLGNPRLSVDKGIVALRTGGALLFGALAMPAAIIPMVVPGQDSPIDNCPANQAAPWPLQLTQSE